MSKIKKESKLPATSNNTYSQELLDAIKQIEKAYGQGSIMRMGDGVIGKLNTISTGIPSLDIAIGGGLPKGRICEIYGVESSGKTTIALQVLAQAQKISNKAVAFIDAEHALDPSYARKLGLDVDNLLISQPESGEAALEILDVLVKSNSVSVVVIDSVAALTPKAEIEGNMGDHHIGAQARLMSQALRKLASNVFKSDCLVLFINQLRMKVGVVFGNPEVTAGGNALKFYASVRLEIRRSGLLKEGDTPIGHVVKVKAVKNKVFTPFYEASFDLIYGAGCDYDADLFKLAVERGIIEQQGAWFKYKGQSLGQGKDKAVAVFKSDSSMYEEIKKQIIKED